MNRIMLSLNVLTIIIFNAALILKYYIIILYYIIMLYYITTCSDNFINYTLTC